MCAFHYEVKIRKITVTYFALTKRLEYEMIY